MPSVAICDCEHTAEFMSASQGRLFREIPVWASSEDGQPNVHLAVAYEAALKNLEIRIGSFAPWESHVMELQEHISKSPPSSRTIACHPVAGVPMIAATLTSSLVRKGTRFWLEL